MRTTIILSTLCVAGLALLLTCWLHFIIEPSVPLPSVSPPLPPVTTTSPMEAPTLKVVSRPSDAPAPSALPAATSTNPQAVENRIAELETLALNDDVNSLNLILVALSDGNPQIREAALAATVQFGSAEAIPTLQYALMKTDLAEEKVKIQEAIDFLKLSPLAATGSQQP